MESFSERHGLKPRRQALQVGSMDESLRVGLWNVLFQVYLNELFGGVALLLRHLSIGDLVTNLWSRHLKKPLDTLPMDLYRLFTILREYYFGAPWNEVYDFIEFFARNDYFARANVFTEACDQILETELAGYRFVGNILIQITEEVELAEIEEALITPNESVSIHLKRSVELIGLRPVPDNRNGIKEAISAVEAISRLIAKNDRATLHDAIVEITRKGHITRRESSSQKEILAAALIKAFALSAHSISGGSTKPLAMAVPSGPRLTPGAMRSVSHHRSIKVGLA